MVIMDEFSSIMQILHIANIMKLQWYLLYSIVDICIDDDIKKKLNFQI